MVQCCVASSSFLFPIVSLFHCLDVLFLLLSLIALYHCLSVSLCCMTTLLLYAMHTLSTPREPSRFVLAPASLLPSAAGATGVWPTAVVGGLQTGCAHVSHTSLCLQPAGTAHMGLHCPCAVRASFREPAYISPPNRWHTKSCTVPCVGTAFHASTHTHTFCFTPVTGTLSCALCVPCRASLTSGSDLLPRSGNLDLHR